jgi:excisionase family DNA binding protein
MNLLTINEAATRLRLSKRSVHYLIASGQLRAVHPVPRRTLLLESDVDAFIASLVRKVA